MGIWEVAVEEKLVADELDKKDGALAAAVAGELGSIAKQESAPGHSRLPRGPCALEASIAHDVHTACTSSLRKEVNRNLKALSFCFCTRVPRRPSHS